MTTTSPQATDRTDPVHARLQYQLAVFARRMDQVRTTGGGLGALDRAAYLLLDRLERHGPANVKALAESLGVDSSTVTRQVAPLVAGGLVGPGPVPAPPPPRPRPRCPRGARRPRGFITT
ncbi:MarR family transcriptional regulator, partial [Kitasatospora sp. NPDC059811]|uniref:MarR family transcriptional regulator n=1 Tax=Kitasatospora sp. NPDC059811 TaxID=3346957 RepID=UPI00365CB2D4